MGTGSFIKSRRMAICGLRHMQFFMVFTHSLNRIVARRIKSQQLTHRWSPDSCALSFIVLSITGDARDRMSARATGSPVTDIPGLIVVPVWGWAMWQTQLAVNVARRDPEGESNSSFTVANYVWIAIGALFWAQVPYGLCTLFTGRL